MTGIESKEEKHQLEYSIYSCKVSWCPICNQHFYNERNSEHTTKATEEHYHIVTKALSSLPVQEGEKEKFVVGEKYIIDKGFANSGEVVLLEIIDDHYCLVNQPSHSKEWAWKTMLNRLSPIEEVDAGKLFDENCDGRMQSPEWPARCMSREKFIELYSKRIPDAGMEKSLNLKK